MKDNRGKTAADMARDGGHAETLGVLEGWRGVAIR
jgi:hypothetical protein